MKKPESFIGSIWKKKISWRYLLNICPLLAYVCIDTHVNEEYNLENKDLVPNRFLIPFKLGFLVILSSKFGF